MTTGPVANLRSKKLQKSTEPSARIKLSVDFINGLEQQWREHGNEILDAARKENPTKLAELVARLVPQDLPPTGLFDHVDGIHDIGRRLLMSVGFSEPDEVSIQAAIEANDRFIAELQAIRDNAQETAIQ